ncbi:MAG: DinB family protein [Ignavibacteria bacterium]
MLKPLPEEIPEYYKVYINTVPEGDIKDLIKSESGYLKNFLESITPERVDKTYAFGKWTVKEVIGHLLDSERISMCRILRISRGDKQSLPGYDQDEYITKSRYFLRNWNDIVDEKIILRGANLKLIESIDETQMLLSGYVNDFEMTVNMLLYVFLGHELHHLKFLKENYEI